MIRLAILCTVSAVASFAYLLPLMPEPRQPEVTLEVGPPPSPPNKFKSPWRTKRLEA